MAYHTVEVQNTQDTRSWFQYVAMGAAVGVSIGLMTATLAESAFTAFYAAAPAIAPGATRVPILRSVPEHHSMSDMAVSRRGAIMGGAGAAAAALNMGATQPAWARKTGVNKPELLPAGPVVNVIDTLGTFTKSQLRDLNRDIDSIQRLFGVKLRILTQRYPDTPGLAIAEYWGVDDMTVVLVADDTFPNLINLNVGANVDILAPNGRFWASLQSNYGTTKFVRKYGEDEAILQCVSAMLDGLTNSDETGASMMMNN